MITNDPLYRYTIAEIALHLEKRGFGPEHIIDLGEDSWTIEHPLRCRLLQYDELSGVMRTLRDTCAVNQAFEYGLADRLRARRGVGRFSVGPRELEDLSRFGAE
jgi:hypothetical protein